MGFYNPCKADAVYHPERTTVVGDIEEWARLYLDTGQHLKEWDERIAAQTKRLAEYETTQQASPLLSSDPW